MNRYYKKIPGLLRFFAFLSFLWSLLIIFFSWLFLWITKYAHTVGNDIIGYYRSSFPDYLKIAILRTIVCIIISSIFIFIIYKKAKIRETDQIENNPKITSKNPLKRIFFAVLFSFLGILAIYYFAIYDQNIPIKDIPAEYFELSWYDADLQPQDNWFLLAKSFLEKDSAISDFFQAISGKQFIPTQNFWIKSESGILTAYITWQAYQDNINSFIDTIDFGIQTIGQEKIDNFISNLSWILYTYPFQYPQSISLSQIDDILINNYEKNILGTRGLYYCYKQDYNRCSQYITLQHLLGNIIYKSWWGLTNMLIWYVYVADTIETLGLIIEKYDIPQDSLLHFKRLLEEPINSQDIFKKNLLYEHILEINTLQKMEASFFIDKDQTRKMFDDYIYHFIENDLYTFQNQPSDIYLSNLYKKFIYPYLDITGIRNVLWLKLFDNLVPRMNIPISLKQKQDVLEELRKSLLEKIDSAIQQKSIQNTTITDTWTILTWLQQ